MAKWTICLNDQMTACYGLDFLLFHGDVHKFALHRGAGCEKGGGPCIVAAFDTLWLVFLAYVNTTIL